MKISFFLLQKSCPRFYESFEETPLLIAILTYMSYAFLVVVGSIRDLLQYYGLDKKIAYQEPKLDVSDQNASFKMIFFV